MDHMRRGTLSVGSLKTLILDEADEMLKMGFIDDIEWILEKIPNDHQTGLFSATMPKQILKIADRYLNNAQKIQIKPTESTLSAIEQVYICVNRGQKLEVLTRLLEVENLQAALIFTRTKTSSAELAEKLQARGYAAAALNGDMAQSQRKAVIERIKKGDLDIVVATDVAARGIDIDRISHVINYDIPHDTESYIHRIGRTGRAGRKGKALLFIAPRELRLLRDIERATHATIKQIEPPSLKEMNDIRSKQLAEKVVGILTKSKNLKPYQEMICNIMAETDCAAEDIAAALAYLNQQSNPLANYEIAAAKPEAENRRSSKPSRFKGKPSSSNNRRGGSNSNDKPRRSRFKSDDKKPSARAAKAHSDKRKPSGGKKQTGAKKTSHRK